MKLLTSFIGEERGVSELSAAGYALVRWAAERELGTACPEIVRQKGKKPYFSGNPCLFFSMSHSAGRILVGISRTELGVDTEKIRSLHPKLEERIMSSEMRRDFNFFEAWTLRESVFKLMGEGSLVKMELKKGGGEVFTPYEGVKCRSYFSLPGFVCSAADFSGDFPEKIEELPPEIFFT